MVIDMWIHFVIVLLIFLFSYVGYKYIPNNKILCISIFVPLFALAAFRSINVGNDTKEYFRIFQIISNQSSITSALTVSRYEPGYIIYNYLLSRFTDNFQWVLAINAGIYLTAVLYFLNKYLTDIRMGLMLFFSFGLYYNVMNLERQCIATAIFLFAFPFLEDKKYIKYIILILFAATFHSTALILMAIPLIPEIDFSKKNELFKWTIISVIFLVLLNYGITFIISYFPYMSHYMTDSMYSVGGVRSASVAICLLRLLSVGLIILVFGKIYQEEDSARTNLFNKMILLDCVISIASIGFNMYDRIEKYICIGFIVAITNNLKIMSNNNRRIVYGIIFILSFSYLTISLIYRPGWSGIFPYALYK